MKVFLIVLAVIVLLTAILLSLSAEFTIIFDNGWTTRIRVLFIEKDIELSKILSFILFPEKAAEQATQDKKEKAKETEKKADKQDESDSQKEKTESPKQNAQPKPNALKKLWDDEGLLGIMLLVSNLLQTVNSAVTTLIKGLHIYSLYVRIIIGGGDAADIGDSYGNLCGIYYPIKGYILNSMRVDQYDDLIMPDFIAPRNEYEFQFIGSINIYLLIKVLFKAAKVFIVNYIKNK